MVAPPPGDPPSGSPPPPNPSNPDPNDLGLGDLGLSGFGAMGNPFNTPDQPSDQPAIPQPPSQLPNQPEGQPSNPNDILVIHEDGRRELVSRDDVMIVTDDSGEQMVVPKSEWRQSVLPGILENTKNDADLLYQALLQSVEDGFADVCLPWVDRLSHLDKNPERSTVLKAIILEQLGKFDDAEDVLREYRKHYGDSGVILLNLAKVYAARKQYEPAVEVLWSALSHDPNQPAAVEWWGEIGEQRHGEGGYLKAMEQLAEFDQSWFPQIWLARHALEQGNEPAARKLYQHILGRAPNESDALVRISGDMGASGYPHLIHELVVPFYIPEHHGPFPALNILQSYLNVRNVEAGEQLLTLLKTQENDHFADIFHEYELAFAALKSQPESSEHSHEGTDTA